jgi:hypothetical protein
MKTLQISLIGSLSVAILMGVSMARAEDRSMSKSIENADAAALGLKPGAPFLQARARLIKAGWKPIRVHGNDTYEYSGTEKLLADRGFLEVDSCSTDAGSLCILYYSKASQCLRLDTIGEQIHYMRIRDWMSECPADMSSR